MRYLSLGILLFVFWLVLSGHYTGLLITFGILSAIGCVILAQRMNVIDLEGHPIHLIPGALGYFAWLAWEIVKSSWTVAKITLHPSLPISPKMIRVVAGQKTPLGVSIYGQSITLTPGTITVAVKGHDLTVHALTSAGAADLATGEMDQRVTRFEGES